MLFPSECRLCGMPLEEARRVPVCAACVEGVSAQQDETLCTWCGEAIGFESLRFAQSMGSRECTQCRMAPPAFARAVAYAEYGAETREMLQLLKFASERSVAEHVLGARLAAAIAQLEGEAAPELVVIPVPVFADRVAERGFNQATLLASAALRELRRTHRTWKLTLESRVLLRVKPTPPLFTLTPAQRRNALQGAFKVENAEAIQGREVLLVDDIMTTGTTAGVCTRVLLRAGAAKVWVATVARAQPRDRLPREGPMGGVARWDAVQ